jgi:hypothetical protein
LFCFSIPLQPLTRARNTNRVGAPFVLPFFFTIYIWVCSIDIFITEAKRNREKKDSCGRERKKEEETGYLYIAGKSSGVSQIFTLRTTTDRLAPALSFSWLYYYIYSPRCCVCLCISTLCGGGGSSVSVRRRSGIDDESPLQDGGLYSSRAQQLRLTPDTFSLFFFPKQLEWLSPGQHNWQQH